MFESRNLEVHVTDHCNLDCVNCSHESPLMAKRSEDPDLLRHSLRRLWRHYQAPLIKLLGGEPLLHPDIEGIIRAAKVANTSLRLVTNGTLLLRNFSRLEGVNEIHISLYSGASIPDEGQLMEISAWLKAPITLQPFSHFRVHRSAPHLDSSTTDMVFETCQMYHVWQCHTLRAGWLYPCPAAATWGSDNKDGINLQEDGTEFDLGKRIDLLLAREVALKTCDVCLGSVGKRLEHHRGWRQSHAQPRHEDVDIDFASVLRVLPTANNGCYQYHRTIHPDGHTERYR